MISLRRHSYVLCACAVFLGSGAALAQAKPPRTLPLKSVRLYEAGVGYFERTGRLGESSGVGLPVPTAHLDDALKTLVVLGRDGKTSISGIEFGSSVSADMGRALAGLPTGSGDAIAYADLLRSLKGAPVEIRAAGETLRGRLLDVVEPAATDVAECVPASPGETQVKQASAAPSPCALQKQMAVLLLTDHAEIRRFRSSEVVSVRPTDPGLATRLRSALDALSVNSARAQRELRVLATGSSDVTLGYVAETPVWRSTYRLVFEPGKPSGVLQGWALVHNDTDEDWKQVKVDLVNGRPDSFLFPLAAPRYTRRELVAPPETLSTVPQLLGGTVDSMWGTEVGEAFGAGGLGLSGVGEGGGGRGEGIGLGSIGTIGHGAGSGSAEDASTLLSVGNLASVAQADGVEAGALFRYTLKSPIDVRAHGSTLVPFLQKSVGARRMTWFAAADGPGRSAARFKNDSGQTLPAGTIAFFGDGGFAGEATLDRMKPSESRIVAFGADLDVELRREKVAWTEETELVVVENDLLVEHFVRHHDVDYTLTNRSGSARTVFLTLNAVKNARVVGADEVDFDVPSNHPLAVFAVDAKTEGVRKLAIDQGLSRKYAIERFTAATLRKLATGRKLAPPQRAILRDAADRLAEAEARRAAVPKLSAELAQIENDLKRLRGHLAATRPGAPGAEQFVARMLTAEDRMRAVRARVSLLSTEADAATARARTTLAKLTRP